MSFKEHLEQLKAARKAGLLNEQDFRRAKNQLFTELKSGVVASPDTEPGPLPQPAAEPAPTVPQDGASGQDEGADLSFKGRLEQLKQARKAGFLNENDFRSAKTRLFTELKHGVAAASPPADSSSPAQSPSSQRFWLDEDKPRLPNSVVLLLGLTLLGSIGGGAYWWWQRDRNTVVEAASAPAVPQRAAMVNVYGKSAAEVQALQRQTAELAGVNAAFRDTLANGGQGPEMVVIPAGPFVMGSPPEEGGKDDELQHMVTITQAFAISKYPITFQEYALFAKAEQRELPSDQGWGRGQRPLINVSWREATAYAAWLSAQTGNQYRLPTEAEWEYAARAGTTTPFHFGVTINTEQANYNGNFVYPGGVKGQYRGQTFPVGQFLANAWGMYDVHGNVWNWTCSVYDPAYGGAEQHCADAAATGPLAVRGGSWSNEPKALRAASRFRLNPDLRFNLVGFRVVRRLPKLSERGADYVF